MVVLRSKSRWLPASKILFALCTLDMLSTALLLASGQASESNPLFDLAIQVGGIPGFLAIKTLSFAVPITLLEYLRRFRPDFIKRVFRVGLCGYVSLYVTLSLWQNL